MRKELLLLLALAICALSTWAQTQVAALTHNGQVRLYYGADAFANAATAASHGDVINLSAGTFKGTTIEKRITVRGAGMLPDEANATEATIISSVVTLTGNASSLESGQFTQFEGIDFLADKALVASGVDVSGVVFVKCRLRNAYYSSGDKRFTDCHFYSCHILDVNSSYYFNFINSTFNNSFCHLPNYQGFPYNDSQSENTFDNCVIRIWNYSGSGSYFHVGRKFNNCILYGFQPTVPNTVAMWNCLFINPDSNVATIFNNIENNTNKVADSFSSIFKNFIGNYTWKSDFTLTDEAKSTYLGTDGTQIGMYGGNTPYSPMVSNPRITKCDVAGKTSADGKLAVDITVEESN